jgi:ATP-dependent 26S proteasome regulatory subunit
VRHHGPVFYYVSYKEARTSGSSRRRPSRSIALKEEIKKLILEKVPDISYHDIGGLADQIEQICDAVELPFLHADLFADHQLKPPKDILLYGPPGCGKTLIAKADLGL